MGNSYTKLFEVIEWVFIKDGGATDLVSAKKALEEKILIAVTTSESCINC